VRRMPDLGGVRHRAVRNHRPATGAHP
jgi:hypothetical protein